MRVFVAGASGAVGRPLCRLLREQGHQVVALTRQSANGDALRALGAEPVIADVYDAPAVAAAMAAARPDAVVHQLTAIPARTSPRRADRDVAPTSRLRTEGTRILLDAAVASGARRFIAQSISFVLSPEGSSPAEEEPVWPGEKGFTGINQAVRELEARVTEAKDLVGVALRYGAFYGPGTAFAPGGAFHQDVSRRLLPVVGSGAGVFSFIHVCDAAGAAAMALERGDRGVYHIVDDEPAPVKTWLPYYAACLGAPSPYRVPAWLAYPFMGRYGAYLMTRQRGASNRKAREVLGWSPSIPTWRSGFRERLDR